MKHYRNLKNNNTIIKKKLFPGFPIYSLHEPSKPSTKILRVNDPKTRPELRSFLDKYAKQSLGFHEQLSSYAEPIKGHEFEYTNTFTPFLFNFLGCRET